MPITGYENYREFVGKVLKVTPIMKTEQLKLMISNYFNQPLESVNEIVFALKSGHEIILSSDNWVMTVGKYRQLIGDKYFNYDTSSVEGQYKLVSPVSKYLERLNMDVIKALWVVIDMMPRSEDYVVTSAPWALAFTTKPEGDKPGLFYEITVIRKGEEIQATELLKILPPIQSRHFRETTRRIALIEDPTYAWAVPYLGFSHILTLDESSETHYKVVEKRSEDERWKDMPYEG